MSKPADSTSGEPPSRPGRLPLPTVRVHSQLDMAVMLATHNRLLREQARKYLGRRAKDEAVEVSVERTVKTLLAMESPSTSDGMGLAADVLWTECRRTVPPPVDPQLGPLTRGPVARVLHLLGPLQRETLILNAEGLTLEEIAERYETSPNTVRLRRYRARVRVNQLLAKPRKSLSGLLLLAPTRLRSVVARAAPGLVDGVAPQTVATTALVPLIACSLLWSVYVPPSAALAAPAALAPARGGVLQASTAGPAHLRVTGAPSPRAERQAAGGLAVATAAAGAAAVPLRGAAAETPDDVTLKATATPADGRPVIVAIGKGNTCACPVLLQSLDGGATWTATDGPPVSANQVVVPPDYPRDARIFIGVDPAASAGPFVAAAFGQPFQAQTSLPAGQVAVSAHFDDGDPRLFSSGTTAVWSVRLDTSGPMVPHDEIDYSVASASGRTVAALATPAPSAGDPALLAWVPPLAAVPGSADPPTPNAAVLRCPVAATPCAPGTTLPDSPLQLVASPQGETAVAYTNTTAYISQDGGNSFSALVLPPGVATLASVALVGPASTPWVSYSRADGAIGVARFVSQVHRWVDATADSARLRSYAARLVPVGADRVVAAFGEVGYRCALVAGGSWMPRCPPA